MPNSNSVRLKAIVQLVLAQNPAISAGISAAPLVDNAPYPFIVVKEVNFRKIRDLSGPSGLSTSIIQFDCISLDYDEADSCRGRVQTLMEEYSGPAGTLTIDGSEHNIDTELYDGDRTLHQLITRYQVWWEDTA